MAAVSSMSKKRYQEYADLVFDKIQDQVVAEELLKGLCDIMKFDPDKKHDKTGRYNEKQAKWIKEYRERKKENGISTYITSGAKSYYYSQKEARQSQAVATQQ